MPVTNGRNEIYFEHWESDFGHKVGITFKYIYESATLATPYSPNTPVMVESDIYINPNFPFFIGNAVPSGCGYSAYSIDTAIMHEMGHALGAPHFSSTPKTAMSGSLGLCRFYDVTPKALKHISQIYPSRLNIDINIQSPTENQIIIINQPNTFTANILTAKNNKGVALSKEQIKAAEDDMVWTSSVDGVIGTGNDITPIILTGGEHELTVTVGQPGDAIYGESYSSYFVVDEDIGIINPYTGEVVGGPWPCPRHADSLTGSCYFTFYENYDLPNCTYPVYQDNVYIQDLPFGTPLGEGYNFTNIDIGLFPSCSGSDPRYDIGTWIRDVNTPNNSRISFLNTFSGGGGVGIPPTPHQYTINIPFVNPSILIDIASDCNVSNNTEKCGVNYTWNEKFWVPDAGLFYRKNGESNWTLVNTFPEESSGSGTSGAVVGVEGGSFAVYQYAHDVRIDHHFLRGQTELLFSAPSGLLQGPFPVKAISSNTTPTDPTLVSAQTSCSNNFCIDLRGHNFGSDSYVEIQADTGGNGTLKQVRGNDIYERNQVEGLDRIFFPIQDVALQNRLSSTGLCFWIVNPPEFSDALCITRPATSAQPAFMGKTVESYKQSGVGAQDIEHTSYEVLGESNNELVIWGNSWKKTAYNYTVTPNTILEFSFKSTHQQAEINGIGFIKANTSSVVSSTAWQVYGTQNSGYQRDHNYNSGDWVTYRIPIGESFTGLISDMVFIADEDTHVGQYVIFKNPKIFENIDEYDDISIRGYDDDVQGDGASIVSGVAQTHNFHDTGDADWTLFHTPTAQSLNYSTQNIGSNSSTNIQVYRVTNWIVNPNFPGQTRFIINSKQLIASDNSGVTSVNFNSTADTLYVVKTVSRTNSFGSNTEYKAKLNVVATAPDEYDNISIRGYTDDYEGDAESLNANGAIQTHNFHDAGDKDWTMVWASSPISLVYSTQSVGSSSSTISYIYKVTSAIVNPNYPGTNRFIIQSKQLVASDTNGGNSSVAFTTEANFLYVMKTVSATNSYGENTEYTTQLDFQ